MHDLENTQIDLVDNCGRIPIRQTVWSGELESKKGWSLQEIVDLMASQRIRRLLIVDEKGNTCAVITSENPFQALRRKLDLFHRLAERQIKKEQAQQHRARAKTNGQNYLAEAFEADRHGRAQCASQ
ncbi:MAG: hypothetical protein JNM39_00895 [Bdellovibrionaceae bacterium]|nr:hypothetical protein [Pseudobdellovibrionaceae bacterium]